MLLLMVSFWLAVAPGAFSPISWGLDDAGMYLRYAFNAAAGYGIAWNPSGLPTYGLTSLPYFGWITLAIVIGIPSPLCLVGSSWFFGVFALLLVGLLVWRFSQLRTREPHQTFWLHRPFPLVTILLVPVSSLPALRHIALNGMETTMALCAVALLAHSILSFAKVPSISGAVLLGIISYLCIAVRPDTIWYVCGCPFIAISLVFVLERADISRIRIRRAGYPLAVWALVTAMLVLGDLAIKYFYFGHPLPLPFYTKQLGVSASLLRSESWHGVSFLRDFAILCSPILTAMIWAIYAGYLSASGPRYYLLASLAWLAPVVCQCFYLISVEQLMGYHGRLYAPGLPFVIASATSLLLGVMPSEYQAQSRLRRMSLGVSLGIGILASSTIAHLAPPTMPPNPTSGDGKVHEWQKAVSFMGLLLQKAPAGFRVALTEHGYLGARFPDLVLVDLTGLHNPKLVDDARSLTHQASDKDTTAIFTRLLLRENPDLIWLPPPDYVRLRKAILAALEELPQYKVLPSQAVWGLAVHRDAQEVLELLPAYSQAGGESEGDTSA